jgi:sulfonate transport system substrate-binding protein
MLCPMEFWIELLLRAVGYRHGLALLFVASLACSAAQAEDAIPRDTVLRMGDQKGGSQALMEAAGVLRDVPYTVEWHQFPAAAPLLEALNAGAVDSAFAGDAPTIFALAGGLPGKIIAANESGGRSTAILVPHDSPIRSIVDLKGKRIGTGKGSIGHFLVIAVLEKEKWASDAVDLAFLQPADAKAAFARGAIDAWSTWTLYVAQATVHDGARVIVDGDGLLSGLTFQTATNTSIKTKRAALVDYLHRLAVARRWAIGHVADYAAVWARDIGVSPDIARRALELSPTLPVAIDGRLIAEEQRVADLYQSAHVIPQRLDVTKSFDNSFNRALGPSVGQTQPVTHSRSGDRS